MTVFSSGGYHGLSYMAETALGSATHATMISLRHTSCGLVLSKDTFQSAELRSDRQISDFRHGNQKPAGNIGFELSYEEFDTFLEAALGGTWQAAYSVVSDAVGVKSTGNLFYSATATFTTLATYDLISVSGFTGSRVGNNVVHRITGALPHTLSITGTTLVTAAVGTTITIALCPSVTAGTTQRSFAIERIFSDISKYQQFTGCVINTLSLSIKPNAIITGEFAMVAKGVASTGTPWDATPTVSQTNSPYDAFTGILKEGGSEVGFVTAIDFKLDNAAEPVYVVGSDTTPAIPLGRSNVSGSMDVMFQDLTMLQKFENNTASSVEFYLGSGDPGEKSYRFFMPLVKYGSADNPANDEKPITLKMNYQALYSATEGTNIKVTKIA